MSTIMPKEIADQIGGARREMLACEIHGEYMAIALPNGHVSPCPDCFEMKLRRESGREMKSVQSQNEMARRRSMLMATGIPEKYLSLGFAEYRVLYPQRGQCDVLEGVRKYIERFPVPGGQSIGLVGCTGTGKTHLACAAAIEIMRRGHSVRFVSILTMLRSVKSTYTPGSMTEADVIASYCETDLLVVDDMGVKVESDTDRAIIYEVVERRNLDGKSMIYTSNLSIDRLREAMSDRVLSRLCENGGEIFMCQWPDYRMEEQS